MPKQKTKKSVAKRVRVSKSGKVMRTSSGKRHLNSHMTRKSLRGLGKKKVCAPGDARRLLRMLGDVRP